MDIERTTTIRWQAPRDRADGTPLVGTVGYHLEFESAFGGAVTRFPAVGDALIDTTTFTFTPAALGLAAGDYSLFVRATEEYQGVGKVSARSNGIPFPLEAIAPPSPPYGLEFVDG